MSYFFSLHVSKKVFKKKIGLWDLIDVGLEIDLLKNYEHSDEYKLYSLIITGVAGYTIHFFLLFLQRFRLGFIGKEFVQVFAYLSVVMVCFNNLFTRFKSNKLKYLPFFEGLEDIMGR